MKEIVLLKYGELALKGANRAAFEKALLRDIRRKLSSLGDFSYERAQSALTVIPKSPSADMDEVFCRLSRVFGVSALSRSAAVEKDINEIAKSIDYLKSELSKAKTFKVTAKRSDKTFPMTSPEICSFIGAKILESYPHLSVDVHTPGLVVCIEVRDHYAFIHAGQSAGAGGLPAATAGKAALLLSGGIDSPVAGFMMAKRGLRIMAVHFLSPPYTGYRSQLKVMQLCSILARYTGFIELALVNFTEIQEAIAKNCREEYLTIITRRFMMEIASKLAGRKECGALVTGESLGQVASQTVDSLVCTQEASDLIVFRPLIGMDKEEVVSIARKIETFDVSTLPFEDCCTVFTPRRPKISPKLHLVKENELPLDRQTLIDSAVERTEFVLIDDSMIF
jgi:thiamine biosynthesis protein ThiI